MTKPRRKNVEPQEMNYGEVYPGLFVGSAPVCIPTEFDVVAFMAKEHQPTEYGDPGERLLLIYAPIRDGDPTSAERSIAMQAAQTIASAIKSGRKVLVTCWQGMNRSSFAAGLAMRMLGIPSRKIVQTIRRVRGPEALSNMHFLAILEAV